MCEAGQSDTGRAKYFKKKEPPDQNPEVKAYCLSSFQKVRCSFIGDVRDPGQQEGCISVACVADGIAAAGRTHVTVDGCCLICLQLHKLLYQINRFGSMPAKNSTSPQWCSMGLPARCR